MGFESPAKDYAESRIDVSQYLVTNPSATFFMKVETDAMREANIPPDSIVVIDRSLKVKNQNIIVAVVEGELWLRQYIETQTARFLVPANPGYKAYRLPPGESLQVWGVVSYVIVNMKKQ